ncbi:MAG: helix-turn-helix domain-containing protein [Thermomicrobiales bacterium]
MKAQSTGDEARGLMGRRPVEDRREEPVSRPPPSPWGQPEARGPVQDEVTLDLEPLLIRPETAARLLSISRSRLYELLASGEIPSLTIGHSRRIPRDALLTWIGERLDESR